MTTTEQEVSFVDEVNVLKLYCDGYKLYKFSKNYWIVHLKQTSEFYGMFKLYINKTALLKSYIFVRFLYIK